jgi:hypothetical protein
MEKSSNRKILRRFPERIKKNKVVGKKKRLSFHKIKTDTTMAGCPGRSGKVFFF